MQLPAGGTYHGQVACNKALTTYGNDPSQQNGIYACDGPLPNGGIGAMHTTDAWQSPNPTDVMGCGLGIAYESDATKVQPGDFAMISVNYTCPWFKDVDFQIPADLPPCPEGGCTCVCLAKAGITADGLDVGLGALAIVGVGANLHVRIPLQYHRRDRDATASEA